MASMSCEVFSGEANQRGERDQADGRANKNSQFLPLSPHECDGGRKDGCYQQKVKPAWHDLPIYKTRAGLMPRGYVQASRVTRIGFFPDTPLFKLASVFSPKLCGKRREGARIPRAPAGDSPAPLSPIGLLVLH